MILLPRLLCIAFFGLLAVSAEVDTKSCDSNLATDYENLTDFEVVESHPLKHEIDQLVDWVTKFDGFIDGAQSIQKVNDSDKYGVFATRDFSEGERLAMIPFGLIISSADYTEDEDIKNIKVRLAFALENEIYHMDSVYSDYLEKLINGSKQPEYWSEGAHKLLKEIVGVNLPPVSFSDGFENEGLITSLKWFLRDGWQITEHEETSYSLVLQYSLGDNMVPILDLYNHRNGKYLNTYFNFDEDGLSIYADREIKQGEQIYISYTMCNTCDEFYKDTSSVFRDRGFVEDYPQRWIIGENLMFEVEENEMGYEISYFGDKAGPTYNDMSFLIDEFARLEKFEENDFESMQETVTNEEWTSILKYYESLKTAVELVINSFDNSTLASENTDDDLVIPDEDDVYFRKHRYTCDQWMQLENYSVYTPDDYKSQYQHILFSEDPSRNDKCMTLDTILQICAGYRPHYHEPFVHFPAVFLSSLRRVVFVGGGDSMLLHEVLKFPSIELVVGLELDQKVVRNSFKHFRTLPHFHDDRVEWWFGDATKSLNVIPKEYFGSFDLVMIDLSETVMSFTVTKNLDMLEALALLTKPDGIFVKNEHYYEKIQTMFDHTTELYLSDNPHICDQHFALGSNKIDFMNPNFEKLNGIETLLYKPLQDINTHFDMMIQYSHNNAKDQSKCEDFDDDDDELSENIRPGTLMILNIERASKAEESLDNIKDYIKDIVEDHGLSFLSSFTDVNDSVLSIMMKEGFIIARVWRPMKYFAFDIHLWGSFDKNDAVKMSIVDALGSEDWSTYRIVVGGMIDSKTWESDKKLVGPQIVNNRDCEDEAQENIANIGDIYNVISGQISETLITGDTILVLCDTYDRNDCYIVEAMKNNEESANVVALYTCPSDESSTEPILTTIGHVTNVFNCGTNYEEALYAIVSEVGKIGTVYIDENASILSVQRVLEIVHRKSHTNNLFDSSLLFIAPQLHEFNAHRQSVLPKYRKKFFSEQISLVELRFESNHNKMISFLAINHEGFFGKIDQLKHKIKEITGLVMKVGSMKGNQVKMQYNHSPHFYPFNDYDQSAGIEQFFNQKPVASQSIFQLNYDGRTKMSTDYLRRNIEKNFEKFPEYHILDVHSFDGAIGKGSVIFVLTEEGQVIVTWNGGTRIDINVLTYNESLDHKALFGDKFMQRNKMTLMLLDEQPRGSGRVINLAKETEKYKGNAQCHDDFFSCFEMAESLNLCDNNEKKSWMKEHCKASCGYCSDQ